jgi:hypothetical protein
MVSSLRINYVVEKILTRVMYVLLISLCALFYISGNRCSTFLFFSCFAAYTFIKL